MTEPSNDHDAIIERFLAQPAEHGYADDERPAAPAPSPRPSGWWSHVNHFLFEKRPSQYSSLAPREADGTRAKTFFFNGNGRGR